MARLLGLPGTRGLNFEGYLRVLKHQNTKAGGESSGTRMSMEVIVTIVSKLGYFTYLGDEINLLILGF